MTGRPARKRTDPDYWIPACTHHGCVQGQWASDEELAKGFEDLGRYLAEVEEQGTDSRAGSAASYLAHRIARAHLVRTGRNLYDVRDTLHYEARDAPAIFRASWPWDLDGAEEVGRAVLASPAWPQTAPWFSLPAGAPSDGRPDAPRTHPGGRQAGAQTVFDRSRQVKAMLADLLTLRPLRVALTCPTGG